MYFVKPLDFEFEPVKIANVSENGSLPAEILRFIALYEKQCLVEVLGLDFYNEIVESFEQKVDATEFTLKSDATDEIKYLINGKTYEIEENHCGCGCGSDPGKQRIWSGFVQSDKFMIGSKVCEVKRSFIADYIYYHYLFANRSISSGVGQQVVNSENAVTVMNASKRIDRYNEFVFAVLGMKNQVGLYQFLCENKKDYPKWKCNCSIKFKEKF